MMSHRILRNFAAALVVMVIVAAPAVAGEVGDLWLEKKSGAVEFVNGGDVVGLQFDIKVGEISERAYSCGGNLPEQFIASCFLNGEVLRVIVYSTDNAIIPDSTLLSFNRSSKMLSSSALRAGKGIENVVFSDANGREITPKHL